MKASNRHNSTSDRRALGSAIAGITVLLQATLHSSFSEAAVRAWHTATPLTANAFVESQGSFFSPLNLRCDKSLGDCSWRVTTQLIIQDGTSTLYGIWLRDPAGNATTVSVSQTSIAGSPYSQLHILQENSNNGFVSRSLRPGRLRHWAHRPIPSFCIASCSPRPGATSPA